MVELERVELERVVRAVMHIKLVMETFVGDGATDASIAGDTSSAGTPERAFFHRVAGGSDTMYI